MTINSKTFSWILNGISVVCIIFVLVLATARFSSSKSTSAPPQTPFHQGQTLTLPGVRWDAGVTTVVMALSVNCHYCSDSAPFYRTLVGDGSKNTRFVAVFPIGDAVEQARNYLKSENLTVSDVLQENFKELGIEATPTLIVLDKSGHVQASWTGELSPAEEAEVKKAIGTQSASTVSRENKAQPVQPHVANFATDSTLISADELRNVFMLAKDIPIIDVRPRQNYNKAHIANALNIPLDELEARLEHEVPRDQTIYIFCGYSAACESDALDRGSSTFCSGVQEAFQRNGFVNVRRISSQLFALKMAGINVVGQTAEGESSTR